MPLETFTFLIRWLDHLILLFLWKYNMYSFHFMINVSQCTREIICFTLQEEINVLTTNLEYNIREKFTLVRSSSLRLRKRILWLYMFWISKQLHPFIKWSILVNLVWYQIKIGPVTYLKYFKSNLRKICLFHHGFESIIFHGYQLLFIIQFHFHMKRSHKNNIVVSVWGLGMINNWTNWFDCI